uniref:IS110 family transposase n=1 Tax=Roseihalotalea indica TaxID=2867963 RepID=A0AA49GKB6_9BACT|nr:IS110 family transposase [Tunicatimonas sp. TK19036]WKN34888.1 IS110 family transposase [Tunicatimonas sp. TK19036]WKN34938.1 IS110 family transposase [Tunicatimonas sp. TK19036]
MKYFFFIGIDISKKTLDFAVRDYRKLLFHLKVTNSPPGLVEFQKECLAKNIDLSKSLICCEHTGIYSQHILALATKNDFSFWLESSLRIKRSLGLQRGKNDKIDAIRISEYAFRYADQATIWQPERQIILKLRQLVALRKRLLNAKNTLKVSRDEIATFQDKKLQKEMEKLNRKPVEALEKQITEVDEKIKTLIKEDASLKHLFELVTSVDGIGEVVFCEMAIATNEFKLFSCPRKFACYSGVAPFEHTSGTSIRGGTRVSHLANKQMKKLLHMAALSVVRGKGEMANYYHRKVEQGKNKMLVINAVRNKIIHRVFACIRDDRKYEKNYTATLA